MIPQAIRRLFRTAPDPEARARRLSQQEAQAIVQRTHIAILEALAGIVDPDELEHGTQGRVRCAPQHRDALRAMLAERPPLPAGEPLPWRLVGRFARAVGEVRGRWPQATARLREVLSEAGPPEPGTAALIEFLRAAADTAQAAPWLCRTPAGREACCLAEVTRGEILRVSIWPNDIHIAFDTFDQAHAAVYGALSAFASHLEAHAPASQEIAA